MTLIVVTFVVAGLVKGVTGMGLPTVAMAVLGAALSPLAAAGLLLVPSLVTNLWQLLAGPRVGATVARHWPMMVGIASGTFLGTAMLTGGAAETSTAALGAVLTLYAFQALFVRPPKIPDDGWIAPTVGFVTGMVSGATGVFVVPAVPYLQALELDRDDLVQALGLSFTVSTVALALSLAARGALEIGDLGLSAAAVLPALAGMFLGQRLRRRISPALFRKVFLSALLLLGVEMAVRPLV